MLSPHYRIKQAADLLGVSDDTVRRWVDQGRVDVERDPSGRQVIPGDALARLVVENNTAGPTRPVIAQSARNQFRGLVTRVVKDTVMAQVEIQAGPFRVVSLMSREAADELELDPGVLAVATVKATNVIVEIPDA
ncbi:MAG: TOBE domain-containing protein [Dermatophilaceae bacterium]